MQKHYAFADGPFREYGLYLANVALFWSRVVPVSEEPDACWEWTGSRDRQSGYGKFRLLYSGRDPHLWAHRVAYLLTHGNLDAHVKVCHHCDNPPCCRPDHLFVGSQRENLLDMLAKGRGRWKRRQASSSTPSPNGSGWRGAPA